MADLQMQTIPAEPDLGVKYMDALSQMGYKVDAPFTANADTIKAATGLTSFMDAQYDQYQKAQQATANLAYTTANTGRLTQETSQAWAEMPNRLKQLDLDTQTKKNALDYDNATIQDKINSSHLTEQQLKFNTDHQQDKFDLEQQEAKQKAQVTQFQLDAMQNEKDRDQNAIDDLPKAQADLQAIDPHDPNYEDKMTQFYQNHPNAVTNPKTSAQLQTIINNHNQTRSTLSSYQEEVVRQKQLQDLKSTNDIPLSTDVDRLKENPNDAHPIITQGNITRANRLITDITATIPAAGAPPEVVAALRDLQNLQQGTSDILKRGSEGINEVMNGGQSALFDTNGNLNPKAQAEVDLLRNYATRQGTAKPAEVEATIYKPLYDEKGNIRPPRTGEKQDSTIVKGTQAQVEAAQAHPEQLFPQTPEERAKLEQSQVAQSNKATTDLLNQNPEIKALRDQAIKTNNWQPYLDAVKAKLAPVVKPTSSSEQNANNPNPERVVYHPSVLRGTDGRLTDIVAKASNILPAGYKVEPTSGVRTAGQGQHTKGNAQDWKILRPDGTEVPNRGDDSSGLYTQLARAAYGYQERHYPELTGQFTWGGAFGTSSRNPEEPDLMHFDIGGRRGHISRYTREHIGAVMPPGVAYNMPTHPDTGHPMPGTPAEAVTLPSGTIFHDPNGVLRYA